MKIAGKLMKPGQIGIAALVIFGLMVGLFLTLLPSTALAQAANGGADATQTNQAPFKQRAAKRVFKQMGPRLELTGTVAAANANSIQINLNRPQRKQQNGQPSNVNAAKPITFTVDSTTVLFDKQLNKIAATDLQVGSTVTLFPQRLWGQPALQMLFAGTPSELAPLAYHGQLTQDQGNTLVLKPQNGTAFNVIVDQTTLWVDKGTVGRPTSLRPHLPLRILGTKNANGDIKAVLIVPLAWR